MEPTPPFGSRCARQGGGRPAGTSQRRALPKWLAANIRNTSKSLAISPAAMFHVAYGMVLSRWAGSDDVIFGTVLSGRTAPIPGLEGAAGMFLSTVPVRLRLSGRTVGTVLKETQILIAELSAHQHVPLRRIQEWTTIPPSEPLFHALLNCRHADREPGVSGPLDWAEEQWHHPLCVAIDSDREDFYVTIQESAGMRASLHDSLERCLQHMTSCTGFSLERLDAVVDRTLVVKNETMRGQEHVEDSIGVPARVGRTPASIANDSGEVPSNAQ